MSAKPDRKVLPFTRRAKHARHAPWRSAVAALDARLAQVERRIWHLDRHYRRLTLRKRMSKSVVFSVLVHLFVIFGITFKMPDPRVLEPPQKQLEVVLVNSKSKAKPETADALAQHNLDGGGNTDEKRRAQTPLPVTKNAKTDADVRLALRRVEQLEREAKQLMTQERAEAKVESTPPVPKPAPAPTQAEVTAPVSTTEIMQRSLEIARLDAKISKEWDAYQQRPRKKFIGGRTQEFRFARYVEDWRQKIERVGDLNYPQAARDQRLHGSLVVTVVIKADGTVQEVEVNRPSGFKVLDDAARHIVKLAAPFAPFPADIAKDTDLLYITRTWTFTPADRFVATQ
jgi:protein TonB